MSPCVLSPYSHLTVHHTWVVKLSQQILHLVVFLAVFLYVSMVTRDVGAKHVLHQEGQAALLTFTVFLKDTIKESAFYALRCRSFSMKIFKVRVDFKQIFAQ